MTPSQRISRLSYILFVAAGALALSLGLLSTLPGLASTAVQAADLTAVESSANAPTTTAVSITQRYNKLLSGPPTHSNAYFNETLVNDETLIFVADYTGSSNWELFSVPVGGGTPTRISQEMQTNQRVRGYLPAPESGRVVYRADIGHFNLFSTYITASVPITLNSDINGSIDDFAVTPDGQTVIYIGNQFSSLQELFSVPIDGGTPLKLNGPFTHVQANVHEFSITPDGSRVLYLADPNTVGRRELFSVSVAGGTVTKLSVNDSGFRRTLNNLLFTPDGQSVIFVQQYADNSMKLLMAPVDGSAPATELFAAGRITYQPGYDLDISPDGTRLTFAAALTPIDDPNMLMSVPLTGGTPITLTTVDVEKLRISGDGQTVIFSGELSGTTAFELYSMPLSGGPVTALSGDTLSQDPFSYFVLTPDRERVVYLRRTNNSNDLWSPAGRNAITRTAGLYSISVDGGSSVRISRPLTGTEYVESFKLNLDGSIVLYTTDYNSQTGGEIHGLYQTSLLTDTSLLVNEPFTPTNSLSGEYAISENKRYIVYGAAQRTALSELFVTYYAGLEGVLVDGGDSQPENVGSFDVTLRATSRPAAPLTITLSSSTPAVCQANDTLQLTAANWEQGLPLTVTVSDNALVDGDQTCTLTAQPVSSSDAEYSGLQLPSLDILISDNEIPVYLPLVVRQ